LVDKKSDEFNIIQTYTDNTGGYRSNTILEVWRVERDDEVELFFKIKKGLKLISIKKIKKEKRFADHDKLENRKLLWHGTNVAVVVAILKTGLRIMPHSGGRVGKGIYFASENSKSAGYVGTAHDGKQNIGIMFLNEVVLGKEHYITQDDPSLTKPPAGFDCVIAKGQTEPGN
jgi:poly [ADP-ribose] polymerase